MFTGCLTGGDSIRGSEEAEPLALEEVTVEVAAEAELDSAAGSIKGI